MGPIEEDGVTSSEEQQTKQPIEQVQAPEQVAGTETEVVPQPTDSTDETTTQPTQPGATPLPVVKKSHKGLIIGLVIVAVVFLGLVAGGVVYAFVYNSPDNAVVDALAKSLSSRSNSTTGTVSMKTSDATFKADFSSAVSESSQMSADTTVTVNTGGKDYKMVGHFAGTKDAMYVKLDDLKSFISSALGPDYAAALTNYYGSLLDKIDSKWVIIKQSDLESASNGTVTNKETQCIQNEVAKLQSDAATRDEVMNVYRKNPLFIITSKGSDSDGNHYSLTPVSDDKAKSFATALAETKFFKTLDDCTTSDLKSSFMSGFTSTSTSDSTKSTGTIDLWVDGWSHNLNKFTVNIKSDATELTAEVKTKLNSNPTVTIPKGETTFDDLKSEIEKIQQSIMSSYESTVSATDYTY